MTLEIVEFTVGLFLVLGRKSAIFDTVTTSEQSKQTFQYPASTSSAAVGGGVTRVADAAGPAGPVPNQLFSTPTDHSGWEWPGSSSSRTEFNRKAWHRAIAEEKGPKAHGRAGSKPWKGSMEPPFPLTPSGLPLTP